MSDRPDIPALIRSTLAHRDDVLLVMLFGSRATGRAMAGSDVDVGVLAPSAITTHSTEI